jgi:hypothetical protein
MLVVSAHWQTRGAQVIRTSDPETVHDFGGLSAPADRQGIQAIGKRSPLPRLTFKRDYVDINPTPDVLTVLEQLPIWFAD